jgi:hypothetical protein
MNDICCFSGPSEFTHQPMESYVTTDSHKCYALQSGSHQLYIVYTDSIPTYAMRLVVYYSVYSQGHSWK